jgi:hypothetical protein
MADAALSIKIGADVQNALTGIKQVESAITEVGGKFQFTNDQVAKGTGQLARFATQSDQTAKSTKELAYEAAKASDAFANTSSGLGNFGKGLTEAYSAVRRLAFILPGIGIAGIFNLAFEAITNMVGALKETNEVIDKLKSNKNIIAEAVGGTEGDITRVNALAQAVNDSNLTYGERKRALDLLKETNKAYFGDLTLETATTEKLTQRVTEYAQALIQAAVVKGFTDEISKTTIEFNKQNDALGDLKLKLDNAISAQQRYKNVSGVSTGAVLANQVQAANDAFVKQRDIVETLKTQIASYTGKIQDAVIAELKLPLLKPLTPVKVKVIPEFEPQHEALRLGTFLDTSRFDENFKFLKEKIEKTPILLNFSLDVKKAQETVAQAKLFSDTLNGILSNGINNGISRIAEGIGEALATGNVKSIGQSFLQALGGLLEDLGKGLIELGGIKTALESFSLSGPASIALGIAAEVVGAALISSAGKSHKFATGGIVTGPTNALIGEAGPEVVFPLEKLNQFVRSRTGPSNTNVNVRGIISGNDLQLVLARNQRNQAFV